MSKNPTRYLNHILEEARFLSDASEDLDRSDFLEDEILKRAFARSFEIIGEATKNVPDDFRERHDHLEWRKMAGMRDKPIHDYPTIDYEIVWDVVENRIPDSTDALEELLEH